MPYDIIVGRNKKDKKELGDRGLSYIGKGYIKMGRYNSLSNRIFLDVARSHVILVAGKRGSGKSYTLSVIAEELSSLPEGEAQNIAPIIFDTMGIFWTTKFRNEKDKKLLEEWGFKPKNLPVKLLVPYGHYNSYVDSGIPVDQSFALDVSELEPEDWISTFNLKLTNPVSVTIQRILNFLKSQNKQYDLQDIIETIDNDERITKETRNATISLFQAADTWGVFAKKNQQPTKVSELVTGGVTSILDVSVYNAVGAFNVRALVLSLISKKLFNQRMAARKYEEVQDVSSGLQFSSSAEKKDNPLVWIFIDEAHEFLPLNQKTVATDALVQLLREGRQPGISLVLATQQPGKIHRDVMTQSDIVISHRVTSKQDRDALSYIMQSYVLTSIQKHMDDLPNDKGSAIILDDNSERIYPMKIRPKFTWHGGEAPSAVKKEEDI